MLPTKKGIPIYLLKVLTKYTDEEHPLTQKELSEKIEADYGIYFERKTIGSTLTFLEEMGYDIVKKENKGEKKGFYLGARDVDTYEFAFISDAIYSSRSISNKLTSELIKKLSSSLSKYQNRNYNIYKIDNSIKTKNEDLFLNIELIQDAIKDEKQITFNYCIYNDKKELVPRFNGFRYQVSPYFLVNNYGRYYLICKFHNNSYESKNDQLHIFRVDFIKDVEIIEERLQGIKTFFFFFSINEYLTEHIYLFGGEKIEATLLLENEKIIHDVVDWFGKSAEIYKDKKDNKYYANLKCNENALFYWCLQYGANIKVIEPKSLVDRIIEENKKSLEKYK